MQAGLRIGEVARRTGLSPDSIRHYERLGLIPTAPRSVGGARRYPESAVRRVEVVQSALVLGFTLKELAAAMAERRSGRPPCREVRALAGTKLEELERRIVDLQQLRTALATTLRDWDGRLQRSQGAAAGLLDALANARLPARKPQRMPRRKAAR